LPCQRPWCNGERTGHHLGGHFGLATAAVAWHASFAGVLKSTFGRTLLPVLPLGR
jgi:succinate-acetate transporter protein